MTESDHDHAPRPTADDEGIRRRLRDAGPREEPPAEDMAEIRAAFDAAWRERTASAPTEASEAPAAAR